MTNEAQLSKNPIVKPDPPGRLKMEVKKDRVIIEIQAPKGWNIYKRTGVNNFNVDPPIEDTPDSKKRIAEIFRGLIEAFEEE